ncbi:type IV pilus assembly protein PilN [Candidatus Mycosynbacter amalyticus]|uniref:Type IV pilus assembly protein PilN n=1 Tax=Candidatus Mycosynbacter amalyticus TaxID=2665156 RepID=A0A857MNI7_9BACT|nr:hypothetical protein [Candidatus Mycosynbacter amalyticus]QHN43152.1 type IV pilus assembly protein PilN [Candidatus Mycosynbacter amalyticus]
MINLLPPESAKQLRAARHNTLLLKYVVGLGITLGLIVLVYGATFVLMKSTELANNASSAASKQKIANYNQAAAEAKAYTANLSMAKSIFDTEVSYTTALHKIAAALPSGTVIEALNLSPTTIGTPSTLTLLAKTKQDALNVKPALEAHKIANGITIASLNEGKDSAQAAPTAASDQTYPVTLNLNLTFDKTVFVAEEKS